MKLVRNSQESLPIFAKLEDWTLDFSFYHSQDRTLGYTKLVKPQYESSKAFVLTVRSQCRSVFGIPLNDAVFPTIYQSSRPNNEALKGTPDYVTFLVGPLVRALLTITNIRN
jgi:hypothetical protein